MANPSSHLSSSKIPDFSVDSTNDISVSSNFSEKIVPETPLPPDSPDGPGILDAMLETMLPTDPYFWTISELAKWRHTRKAAERTGEKIESSLGLDLVLPDLHIPYAPPRLPALQLPSMSPSLCGDPYPSTAVDSVLPPFGSDESSGAHISLSPKSSDLLIVPETPLPPDSPDGPGILDAMLETMLPTDPYFWLISELAKWRYTRKAAERRTSIRRRKRLFKN